LRARLADMQKLGKYQNLLIGWFLAGSDFAQSAHF
jgi:hypothetical protein